jgi:hypothetical protein
MGNEDLLRVFMYPTLNAINYEEIMKTSAPRCSVTKGKDFNFTRESRHTQ